MARRGIHNQIDQLFDFLEFCDEIRKAAWRWQAEIFNLQNQINKAPALPAPAETPPAEPERTYWLPANPPTRKVHALIWAWSFIFALWLLSMSLTGRHGPESWFYLAGFTGLYGVAVGEMVKSRIASKTWYFHKQQWIDFLKTSALGLVCALAAQALDPRRMTGNQVLIVIGFVAFSTVAMAAFVYWVVAVRAFRMKKKLGPAFVGPRLFTFGPDPFDRRQVDHVGGPRRRMEDEQNYKYWI